MDTKTKIPEPETQPSALENMLNYRVQRLASKMALKTSREVLQGTGIHIAEWRLTCTLMENGPSNVTQISRQLVLDQGRTSRLLKAAEAKGLVKRNPDPRDGRASIFSLTQKAIGIYEFGWPKALGVAAGFDELFSPEEREKFVEFLNRSIEHAE